ncbi:TetR/AcrR family transcriptional regulator, partial [Clostridium sp. SL.3.18]|nr:TetR/AcrR family transcriptional regulator [Clostridium sp. SL.3.18]
TLYHQFKSKESIMDAINERQSERMLAAARKTAEDRSIPVPERMLRVVMALKLEGALGEGGRDMIEHLHKPQNALMHQKSKQIIMKEGPPILAIVLQ